MEDRRKQEIEDTLARARKTVADSRDLMARVNLRIQETDRFLAKQGLTREEVRGFRFTGEQRQLVNEELKRRGLPPVEEEEIDFDAMTAAARASRLEMGSDSDDVVSERQRKFGNFMREIRL